MNTNKTHTLWVGCEKVDRNLDWLIMNFWFYISSIILLVSLMVVFKNLNPIVMVFFKPFDPTFEQQCWNIFIFFFYVMLDVWRLENLFNYAWSIQNWYQIHLVKTHTSDGWSIAYQNIIASLTIVWPIEWFRGWPWLVASALSFWKHFFIDDQVC